MDIQEALKIMRALANGANPETGEQLEADSISRKPGIVKALNKSMGALVAAEPEERERISAEECLSHLDWGGGCAGFRGGSQGDSGLLRLQKRTIEQWRLLWFGW